MSLALSISVAALFAVNLVTIGALFGGQMWVDHLKTGGLVSRKAPDLFRFFDPLGGHLFGMIYSDRYKAYDSRFIGRCIKIMRITLPLGLAMIVVSLIVAMSGV